MTAAGPATPAVTAAQVLILAKAPEPGRVKTRLCPPATPEQAADLAAAALLDTLAAAAAPTVVLAGTMDRAARRDELRAAMRGLPVLGQRGASLGERIAAAHADSAARCPGRATLQLGMDTPQVDAALLARADAVLAEPGVDAVLGPATDGGWWALGLREPAAASMIADVPTSRGDTGERTLAALRAAGLRIVLLPELTDVDTMTDAGAVAAAAPDTRFAAALRTLATTASAAGRPGSRG